MKLKEINNACVHLGAHILYDQIFFLLSIFFSEVSGLGAGGSFRRLERSGVETGTELLADMLEPGYGDFGIS